VRTAQKAHAALAFAPLDAGGWSLFDPIERAELAADTAGVAKKT
jgi:cytochrome c biogenesis factor